jgi:uncharacterized repeat protein (TIGR03803 family)
METAIYRFAGGVDGTKPVGGIALDASGAIYGTTRFGGAAGFGTVFKLTSIPSGYTKQTLYSFAGGLDGAVPEAGLRIDAMGTISGTTSAGGGCVKRSGGCGTVFRLVPAHGTYQETVLYRFAGDPDGATPTGNVIADAAGTLYGTTMHGGEGYGSVFAVSCAHAVCSEHPRAAIWPALPAAVRCSHCSGERTAHFARSSSMGSAGRTGRIRTVA